MILLSILAHAVCSTGACWAKPITLPPATLNSCKDRCKDTLRACVLDGFTVKYFSDGDCVLFRTHLALTHSIIWVRQQWLGMIGWYRAGVQSGSSGTPVLLVVQLSLHFSLLNTWMRCSVNCYADKCSQLQNKDSIGPVIEEHACGMLHWTLSQTEHAVYAARVLCGLWFADSPKKRATQLL